MSKFSLARIGSDERANLIKQGERNRPDLNREQVKRLLAKQGKIEVKSGSGSGSGSGSRSGSRSGSGSSSDTLSAVKEECARVVTKSEHYKDGFRSALLAAQANILRNNQDQLFFETANLVTNKPEGSTITKDQLRNNLTQFVFGDKDQVVKRQAVRDAGKFKHIIYLTILTHKRLLTGSRTQDSTFEKIKGYSELKKNILSAIAVFRGNVKCKNVSVSRKGYKKILGRKTIKECTQQQWANIYLTFPDTNLKKAVEVLVFDEADK